MNSMMVSTGAPITPIASSSLSIRINKAYEKLKNKRKKLKKERNGT